MKLNNKVILVISAIFAILGFYLLDSSKANIKKKDFDLKIEAKNKTDQAYKAIKEEKNRLEIPIDTDIDPKATGIIGQKYNEITTTLGNLEVKQMSINPDFSAITIDMFTELGIKKGDYVAFNFSSSFPAINLATLIAAETMELNPIVMVSIGSSTYGANNPDFTYFDMETLLIEQKIISTKSSYYSLGGNMDIGDGMDLSLLKGFFSNVSLYDYNMINIPDYNENVAFRFNYYNNHTIKLFVNVGGNMVAFGKNEDNLASKHGIILANKDNKEPSGLIAKFLDKNIPVINFLNIRQITTDYNLFESDFNVYYEYKINDLYLLIVIIGLIFLVYIFVRNQKEIIKFNDVKKFKGSLKD